MGKAAFTPGPWNCHRNTSYWEFGCKEGNQLGDVCASAYADGLRPDAEKIMEANAHLIAAAPDLYGALSDLLYLCNQNGHPDEPKEVSVARAALAKARGETP